MKGEDSLLTALNEALLRKQQSCSYYENLANRVPEQRIREVSKSILVSEKQHLELLSSLVDNLQQGALTSDNLENIQKESKTFGFASPLGTKSNLQQEIIVQLYDRIAGKNEPNNR